MDVAEQALIRLGNRYRAYNETNHNVLESDGLGNPVGLDAGWTAPGVNNQLLRVS